MNIDAIRDAAKAIKGQKSGDPSDRLVDATEVHRGTVTAISYATQTCTVYFSGANIPGVLFYANARPNINDVVDVLFVGANPRVVGIVTPAGSSNPLGMVKVAEAVVPASGTYYAMQVDQIPNSFRSLHIVWQATFIGSAIVESIRMHLNGDDQANYEYTEAAVVTSASGQRVSNQNSASIGEASTLSFGWAGGTIDLLNYNNTASRTSYIAHTTGTYSGQGPVQTNEYGNWFQATTVYWVKMFGIRGYQLAAGSNMQVYGLT